MQLRKYQNEGRYQSNACMNAKRHPLLVMPTGTGKTKTAVAITQDRIMLRQGRSHKRPTFVLVPQVEIFQQWVKDYSEAGIKYGMINDKGIQGSGKDVYICMPQSLANIMQYIPESMHPEEIITDESHHSAANTYDMIYDYFENATRLGLTATPYRYDNKPLNKYYTDIIEPIKMQEAIDAEYLAKPLVIVPEQYKIHVPLRGGDFDPIAQAKILGEAKIIGDMIEKYSLIFQGLPVLVACCTFEHAKFVTEKFREDGWNLEHIHSKLDPTIRKAMIRRVKNRENNGLVTVGIGNEGLDIPGLYGTIWMRRTMSLSLWLQLNGRPLRPFPGKEFGIIIDGVGNTVIHGMPQIPRTWSLKSDYIPHEEESGPQMRICPACGVMNSVENFMCWICCFDFSENMIGELKEKRSFPAMVDGKLVVLEDDDMKHEISRKLNEQRRENIEKMREEEVKEEKPVQLTRIEKVKVLRKNLLSGNEGTMFREALNNFM